MTTAPMDYVFADILRNCANDNGQIKWSTAVQAAKEHPTNDQPQTPQDNSLPS